MTISSLIFELANELGFRYLPDSTTKNNELFIMLDVAPVYFELRLP